MIATILQISYIIGFLLTAWFASSYMISESMDEQDFSAYVITTYICGFFWPIFWPVCVIGFVVNYLNEE